MYVKSNVIIDKRRKTNMVFLISSVVQYFKCFSSQNYYSLIVSPEVIVCLVRL